MPSYDYTVIVNGREMVRLDAQDRPVPWDAASAAEWCRKHLAHEPSAHRAEVWRRRQSSRGALQIHRRYEVSAAGFVRRVETFSSDGEA